MRWEYESPETKLFVTDGNGATGSGELSDPAAPVVLELSGDLEGTFGMTVDVVEWVSRTRTVPLGNLSRRGPRPGP